VNPARIAVIPSKRFDDAIINAPAASYLLHYVQHDGAPQNYRRVHRDSTDRGAGAESAAIPLSVGGLPMHWSLQPIAVCALSTIARRKTRVVFAYPFHFGKSGFFTPNPDIRILSGFFVQVCIGPYILFSNYRPK